MMPDNVNNDTNTIAMQAVDAGTYDSSYSGSQVDQAVAATQEFASGATAVQKANKWATARTLSISGDGAGSATIDGSADITLPLTAHGSSDTIRPLNGGDYATGADLYEAVSSLYQTMQSKLIALNFPSSSNVPSGIIFGIDAKGVYFACQGKNGRLSYGVIPNKSGAPAYDLVTIIPNLPIAQRIPRMEITNSNAGVYKSKSSGAMQTTDTLRIAVKIWNYDLLPDDAELQFCRYAYAPSTRAPAPPAPRYYRPRYRWVSYSKLSRPTIATIKSEAVSTGQVNGEPYLEYVYNIDSNSPQGNAALSYNYSHSAARGTLPIRALRVRAFSIPEERAGGYTLAQVQMRIRLSKHGTHCAIPL